MYFEFTLSAHDRLMGIPLQNLAKYELYLSILASCTKQRGLAVSLQQRVTIAFLHSQLSFEHRSRSFVYIDLP